MTANNAETDRPNGIPNTRRPAMRAAIVAVAFCVLAAGLAASTPAASADSHTTPPLTGKVEVKFPNYRWSSHSSKHWTSERSNCGWLVCQANYATTTQARRPIFWYMGDVQGVFNFHRSLAKSVHSDKWRPTGRVQWEIWEKKTGDSRYRRVKTFTPPPQEGRHGEWRYTTPIELDGEVIIRAWGRDPGKRVAVQTVILNHVDVLPEHKTTAQEMCIDGNKTLLNRIAAWYLAARGVGLAFAGIVVTATGVGAPIGIALAAAGIALTVSSPLVSEAIELFWKREEVRNRACSRFHAPVWWDGYSKFDDDVAKITVGWKGGKYETFGRTCFPVRRTRGVAPVEACITPEPATPVSTGTPAPQPTPRPTPMVTLRQTSVDAVHEANTCRYSCTWQEVNVTGFQQGTYRVRCYSHSVDGSGEYQKQRRYYVAVGSDGTGHNSKVCFNGFYGTNVWVDVGGSRSNTITLQRP